MHVQYNYLLFVYRLSFSLQHIIFLKVYLYRKERDEDHCIIEEHGALMEYESTMF